MSLAQHLKLNKNKRGQPWWSRKNKNYITAGDSSTSIIANMEQDMECSPIASVIQSRVKRSQVTTCGNTDSDHVINVPSHDDNKLFINNEEQIGKATIIDSGTTREVGVQCSDVISDALEENTQRIQARMHHIRQTMIDYYSTLIWIILSLLWFTDIDAYIILMDQLFSPYDEVPSLDGVVNITQETREGFQRNILPYQEGCYRAGAHLPAECILAYQEIIYNLLATRGIIMCRTVPTSAGSLKNCRDHQGDSPITVLLEMKHKHHNKMPTMQDENASNITVSIIMITIIVCGMYYVLSTI